MTDPTHPPIGDDMRPIHPPHNGHLHGAHICTDPTCPPTGPTPQPPYTPPATQAAPTQPPPPPHPNDLAATLEGVTAALHSLTEALDRAAGTLPPRKAQPPPPPPDLCPACGKEGGTIITAMGRADATLCDHCGVERPLP